MKNGYVHDRNAYNLYRLIKGLETAVNWCLTKCLWLPLMGAGDSSDDKLCMNSLCDMFKWYWNGY